MFSSAEWNEATGPSRRSKVRSILHLRHHSQTGVLHYCRVVPPELRPIIGKGTISGTLGSKTLDHAALIRWVEIDRDAEQRLTNARQKLAGQPLRQKFARADKASFHEDWQEWCERRVEGGDIFVRPTAGDRQRSLAA